MSNLFLWFNRDLISSGEDLIVGLLSKLTDGMANVTAEGISFSGGPLGEIQGILDKFGIDFNDLTAKFMESYNSFKTDLLDYSSERQLIFELKPTSLPQFPNILQIGSKKPSIQLSLGMSNIIWDKLAAAFTSPTFNGVNIPNIPIGQTFADTVPRGKFPGECYLVLVYSPILLCTILTVGIFYWLQWNCFFHILQLHLDLLHPSLT